MRTDGGDPVQITTSGGANAIESVDGEWLFYIKDHSPEFERACGEFRSRVDKKRKCWNQCGETTSLWRRAFNSSLTHIPPVSVANRTCIFSFIGSQLVTARSWRKSIAAGRIRVFPFHPTTDRFCLRTRFHQRSDPINSTISCRHF